VSVHAVPADEASRLVLNAPLSGVVIMRNAVVGETVPPEQVLATVVVNWALNHRPVVLLMTLLCVVWGVNSARKRPMDAVPDVTTIQVVIITSALALAPVEMEQFVTVPPERCTPPEAGALVPFAAEPRGRKTK
jgi:hypothetical protein